MRAIVTVLGKDRVGIMSLVCALLAQARTLLHRAAEHLRAHRDEFPEYDPENDIFNRCTTDGGFVQIR